MPSRRTERTPKHSLFHPEVFQLFILLTSPPFLYGLFSTKTFHSTADMSNSHTTQSSRTPVYFLSIGGPNFIENHDHPAFLKLGDIGREITTKVKPRAIVVFSAHWQHGPSQVAVNVAEKGSLIYDFYRFPPHFYEYEFPHRGSRGAAENVIQKLSSAGIAVDRVERGLDHGIWVGFSAGMRAITLSQ